MIHRTTALGRRLGRDRSVRIAGLALLVWGTLKLLAGLANYGSTGSWFYFDVWAMFVGTVVLGAGGAILAGLRGRTGAGLVAVALLFLDRGYALVALPGASDLLVGLQVVAVLGLGWLVLADRRPGSSRESPGRG